MAGFEKGYLFGKDFADYFYDLGRSLGREEDNSFLEVVMEENDSAVRSEVRFELPV